MRFVFALLIVAALALPAAAGNGPEHIIGTKGNDLLIGQHGPDVIHGLAGNDRIRGGKAPDREFGNRGNDILNGIGSGNAPDLLSGGRGHDRCIGTKHDTFRSCEVIVIR